MVLSGAEGEGNGVNCSMSIGVGLICISVLQGKIVLEICLHNNVQS